MDFHQLKVVFLLMYFLSSFLSVNGQVMSWIPKSSFSPGNRYAPHGFSVGSSGYIGGGLFYDGSNVISMNDLWEYDANSDTWTQRASLPASGRYAASSYQVSGNGYVLLGYNQSSYLSDHWKYDPVMNQWSQLPAFPGSPRYTGTSFVIGNIAYIGMGKGSGSNYFNDFYSYDITNNSWLSIASLPGLPRQNPVGFAHLSKGYLLGGVREDTGINFYELWEYEPFGDFWSYKSSYPGSSSFGHMTFTYNNKRYFGCGAYLNSGQILINDEFFSYDIQNNLWHSELDFLGGNRTYAIALNLGTRIFAGLGKNIDAPTGFLSDWWEFVDVTAINNNTIGHIKPKLVFNLKQNSILIEFSDKIDEFYILDIFDVKGSLVFKAKINSKDSPICISSFFNPNQLYLARLESDNFGSYFFRSFYH